MTATLLITGVTGQVAGPIATRLAATYEVWGAARFTDPARRAELEAQGVRCARVDLATGDFTELPRDIDYVANFAVTKSNDWTLDLDANGAGIARLIEHCRGARAVLHVSSNAVYQPSRAPFREDSPLGDNHRVMRGMDTYSISKIAAEAFARYASQRFEVPVTTTRLNVPYGDHGGWPAFHLDRIRRRKPIPVRTDGPSLFNPIHVDDMAAMMPRLFEIASIGSTVVNWGGDEVVSIEEWSTYIGQLLGIEPEFSPTEAAFYSGELDLTRMHELVGHTTIGWRDGFARMVTALTA